MCSKHRLEDVTAMNNEGDEVIVKRVYEPKSALLHKAILEGFFSNIISR